MVEKFSLVNLQTRLSEVVKMLMGGINVVNRICCVFLCWFLCWFVEAAHAAGVLCLQEFAMDGLVNIVGGCCGTTPSHIRSGCCRVSHQEIST